MSRDSDRSQRRVTRGRGARSFGCVLALLLGVLLAGCSVRQVSSRAARGQGVYHTVRADETLVRIGEIYGIPFPAILRANGITDPSSVKTGQVLLIPTVNPQEQYQRLSDLLAVAVRSAAPPSEPSKVRFSWPVDGAVTSGFGPRHGAPHDGIDIGAPVGTPVYAAADGEVVYASTLRGYGNLVVVRHPDGYLTVYGHNRENRVHEGDDVERGDLLATVGTTGRTTGPNLHFEVRHDKYVYDPLYFLPPQRSVVARGN